MACLLFVVAVRRARKCFVERGQRDAALEHQGMAHIDQNLARHDFGDVFRNLFLVEYGHGHLHDGITLFVAGGADREHAAFLDHKGAQANDWNTGLTFRTSRT